MIPHISITEGDFSKGGLIDTSLSIWLTLTELKKLSVYKLLTLKIYAIGDNNFENEKLYLVSKKDLEE